MSSHFKLINSQSNASFENENDDHYNQTENNSESPQNRTSAEPITNPTGNTHQNRLQTLEPSCSDIFKKLVRNFLQICNQK